MIGMSMKSAIFALFFKVLFSELAHIFLFAYKDFSMKCAFPAVIF